MSSWQRWQCVGKYHHPSFYKNAKSEPGRDVWVPDVFHQCQEFPWVCLDSRETEKKGKTLGHQGSTQCALECYGARESEKKSGGRRRETRRVFAALTVCGSINSSAFLLLRGPQAAVCTQDTSPSGLQLGWIRLLSGTGWKYLCEGIQVCRERKRVWERERAHWEERLSTPIPCLSCLIAEYIVPSHSEVKVTLVAEHRAKGSFGSEIFFSAWCRSQLGEIKGRGEFLRYDFINFLNCQLLREKPG